MRPYPNPYDKKPKVTRQCPVCNHPFETNHPQKLYCSPECVKRTKDWMRGDWSRSPLATGTTGAISELKVCIDLLTKGYEVFRSVSPCCSCDVAVLRDGKLLRVEVTTGYMNPKTQHVIHCGKKATSPKYDILAVVVREGIIYTPELPSPVQSAS